MFLRAFPILLLTACAACGSMAQGAADSEARLEVQPTPATAGDSLVLVLENRSAEQLGYNLCSSGLETRVGTSWEQVPQDRACTLELRILDPGETDRFAFLLPRETPPGEYRVTTSVERMDSGERREVVSPTFRVRQTGG